VTEEWAIALFGDATIVQGVAWVGAFVGLVFVVVKAWPWLKRAVRLVDALAQLPDFIDRTDKTLAGQDMKIEQIHHEVNYNNGSSVKDAVSRIELGMKATYDQISELNEADAAIRADLENTRPKPHQS